MRFKTSNLKDPKHSDLVSCVAWMSPDDVVSIGDDHKVFKWNLVTAETVMLTQLADDFFPTDMHWFPRGPQSGAGGAKTASEVFLVASAEGKLQLMGKGGRVEKTVDAHRGACLCARWSHDGAGVATAGEDGAIKIWSRSGMLRSTLAQNAVPVYSLAWSPDGTNVLFATDKSLTIKPLSAGAKPIVWHAHEGVILATDWSASSGRIVSGGEDCRYRVWDALGRQLFSSSPHESPVTSLAWSPDGQLLAVGAFNTLRLCDRLGWSHSLDKPSTGSITRLSWSADSTQIAGACGNGNVIFAHVIEKRIEWKEFEATVTGRKNLSVRNVTNDAWEHLDFRDRIIQAALGHAHLIVATTAQCYVYSTKNWNTPAQFDLKDGAVSLVVMADKYFLLVSASTLSIFTYEGRLVSSPKWPGMRTETLTAATVSLSNDTLAVRDQTDERNVHLFDASSGKPINDGRPFTHRLEVAEVALDQVGLPNQRKLAIIDKNRDLFLVGVRRFGQGGQQSQAQQTAKIGAMVQSAKWNTECSLLAVLQDARFTTYVFPAIVFVDRGLLPRTVIDRDSSEFGKNPAIVSFVGSMLSVRRADGSLVATAVSPFAVALAEYALSNRWAEATRLCRFVRDDVLWACLAGMATQARHLDTAEVAYAAIHEADKVHYIQYIKELPSKEARNAEMAVLTGNYQDAENTLLQAGLVFRAILLNINLHQWERALDLAVKQKTHVDTVLAYRSKYLARYDKEETIKKYLEYMKEFEIDWEQIEAKVQEEYRREREMGARATAQGPKK